MLDAISDHSQEDLVAYFAPKRQRFCEALLTGDCAKAAQVGAESAAAHKTLADIYLYVITPALEKIGESWCRQEIGIGEEKIATQIVIAEMERLRAHFAPSAASVYSPYRVMVAAVEGEQHDIGGRMVADLCLARGWNVQFLGANVPAGAIVDLVKRYRPQVLGLSATMTPSVSAARRVIDALTAAAVPVKIVLGGLAVLDLAAEPRLALGCEVVTNAAEGVETISRLLRANLPKAMLKEYQLVLARRVRELRTQRGWTQEHLAEATKVTRVCIVAVEGGKQNVSMDILVRLANALNVTPEVLLSGEG